MNEPPAAQPPTADRAADAAPSVDGAADVTEAAVDAGSTTDGPQTVDEVVEQLKDAYDSSTLSTPDDARLHDLAKQVVASQARTNGKPTHPAPQAYVMHIPITGKPDRVYNFFATLGRLP